MSGRPSTLFDGPNLGDEVSPEGLPARFFIIDVALEVGLRAEERFVDFVLGQDCVAESFDIFEDPVVHGLIGVAIDYGAAEGDRAHSR
jgi:hypothetical protein